MALFFFGWLIFNYPILYLFGARAFWYGIPLVFIYIFLAWLLLIAFIALVVEKDDQ